MVRHAACVACPIGTRLGGRAPRWCLDAWERRKAGEGWRGRPAAWTTLSGGWPAESPTRPFASVGSHVGAVCRLIRHNDRGGGRFLTVDGLVDLLPMDRDFLGGNDTKADLVAA